MKRVAILLVSCLLAAFHLSARSQAPRSGEAQAPLAKEIHAVTGTLIYPAPDAAPIPDGVVLMQAGKIVAAGPRAVVDVPPGATVLDGNGLFVVAAFQNSHVHFMELKWDDARALPASQLAGELNRMLLKWGFVTVVDTGSLLDNTLALRRRIESGEVAGPRILTAGPPLYPENAIPYYLRETLPPSIVARLPMPASEAEAAAMAAKVVEAGADVLKLFTGSWVERGQVRAMAAPIARAAADEAHRRGKLVFSHASDMAGLESALQARVDVLAHALDDERGWDRARMDRMLAGDIAVIPTLKLFAGHAHAPSIRQKVGDFARAGGQILFGTDAGYLTDYDPASEYELMAAAGLDWRQILSSLTTAPAARFGEAARRGRIAPGMDADLVLLAADPALDPAAFARVEVTLRGGRIVHAQADRRTAPAR